MAIFKCKMCGGTLEITEESTVYECEYCGSRQTVPTADDEKKMTLFNRANRLRAACEFDKAAGVYESIAAEFPEEAEAFWGIILCRYGIEYVDDPATAKKVPTCHRSSFDSIFDDADFDMVLENSDPVSRGVYREEAKAIEKLRTSIIEVSAKEEPYDIFICYKETDELGQRTLDSVIAQDVYDALTAKGYKVFFSRISLEDKLGQEYEPYIFAALNSAKIMLAFGTDYEYFNAVWVKNEWSRYLALIAKGDKKTLIPCYKGIDAYDMPKEFAKLQAQDMGKVGATQDLMRGIEKILKPVAGTTQVEIGIPVAGANTDGYKPLLDRGFMTLEDGDYAKADGLFEDVLNMNPKCAEAYMGKLMAYYKVDSVTAFARKIYQALFVKKPLSIRPEFDAADILRHKLVGADELSDGFYKRVQNAFVITVDTNINALKSFDASKDYIALFCSLDNKNGANSQIDDRYYERYLQFADNACRERFDISKTIGEIVTGEITKETARFKDATRICNEADYIELIETVNKQIEDHDGEELARVESEYQEAVAKWEAENDAINAKHKAECDKVDQEWPAICQALEEKWENECTKVRAERSGLNAEINALTAELSSLTGLFKGKRKAELEGKISALKTRMSKLAEPAKPDYSSGPVYPKKPEAAERPVKETIIGGCNKSQLLVDELASVSIHVEIIDISKFKVGNVVSLGNYKDEDVRWQVLDMNGTNALVISDKILDTIPYHNKDESITWETCSLRAWLNDEFYNTVFDDSIRAAIVTTNNNNPSNSLFHTPGGDDTIDNVFLLSIDEAYKYFETKEARAASGTEYAKSTSLHVPANGNFDWWLRSPGSNQNNAAIVDFFGNVSVNGRNVKHDITTAVRPACWVDISNL